MQQGRQGHAYLQPIERGFGPVVLEERGCRRCARCCHGQFKFYTTVVLLAARGKYCKGLADVRKQGMGAHGCMHLSQGTKNECRSRSQSRDLGPGGRGELRRCRLGMLFPLPEEPCMRKGGRELGTNINIDVNIINIKANCLLPCTPPTNARLRKASQVLNDGRRVVCGDLLGSAACASSQHVFLVCLPCAPLTPTPNPHALDKVPCHAVCELGPRFFKGAVNGGFVPPYERNYHPREHQRGSLGAWVPQVDQQKQLGLMVPAILHAACTAHGLHTACAS